MAQIVLKYVKKNTKQSQWRLENTKKPNDNKTNSYKNLSKVAKTALGVDA